MKPARLNFTLLLYKYEDMFDALDFNSMTKAWQINLQFIVIAHINYKNVAMTSFLLFITCFLCSSLVNTVYTYIIAIFLDSWYL